MIPVQRLHHVGVVVRDLRASACGYALLLGIERWEVAHHTSGRLSDTSAFGFAAPFTYATATGRTAAGITFRLVQPTGGFSTFTEFLVTRGEGIHGLCLAELDEAEFGALRERLRPHGVPVGQAATVDGATRHYHLDTRAALGGFYVEVVVPLGDRRDRADEVWDLGAEVERPAGVAGFADAARVWHFGVAARSLVEKLTAYSTLLGLTGWTSLHFRPEAGSLDRSTLDGHVVEHAFLLARADVADFGFEVIQPTVEPTHYRREFLDRFGEGIHHVLLMPDEREARWLPLREWLESVDVPVAMSGRVRSGAAEFFYMDTRRRLGGYLVEAICRYPPAAGAEPPRGEPDFTFDLSKRAPV